ncbi:MAG: YigZ family protein [Clostridia bacterium]|nr:YigZ family protein [Clostridia bacterium]
MSKKDSYKTVSWESETSMVEKKSKFIANVRPVSDEAEALEFLNKIRSRYPDATHNVYAYVIDENNIFRYSDDGEPSGTAGMPVLDAIRKAGIVDVAVVVTRYFGGTLLGTGGLVHAYGTSASMGLNESKVVIREKCDILAVTVDYTLVGKIQYKISSDGFLLEDTVYADEVTFKICSPIDMTTQLIAQMTDITNGKAVCNIVDNKYVDKEV